MLHVGPFIVWHMQDDSVAVKERHLGLHRPADVDVPGDNAERLG